LSPLSPSVNLVSSAITPIKIQENGRPKPVLIETFKSVNLNKGPASQAEQEA